MLQHLLLLYLFLCTGMQCCLVSTTMFMQDLTTMYFVLRVEHLISYYSIHIWCFIRFWILHIYLQGVISVISLPTVWMTLCPNAHSPTIIPTAPNSMSPSSSASLESPLNADPSL